MDISDPREIRAMNLMIQMACKHTPDMPELLDKQAHLFFIVDDFQHGCPNHAHLGDSEYGCRAYSLDGVEAFRETLTNKVVPFYERRKPELVDKKHFARIRGEVYKVPTKQIPKLDTEMRNGVQFVRKRIELLAVETFHWCVDNGNYDYVSGLPLPYTLAGFKHWVSPERVVVLKAWMYTAKRDYWNPLIDGMAFDHVEIHDSPREWLRRYYKFNKRRNE